ncbi:uroporphyrin-III C-methyltransferase [Basidiobolus ranarum]|uniref:precorrin-2 dehydrogenase n=1 Tax=Basidiobolus ranarum TaxID=34480 RepID=A0ABR2WNE9_9FUNG
MSEEFPKIEGGGSLVLAWRVKDRTVLIVGGGNVAAGRIFNVLEADGRVTVVTPEDGLHPEVKYRIEQKQISWINRNFEEQDLNNVDMVMTAIDDHVRSKEIYHLCKERNIPVNVADVPPLCDFWFMSTHRDGPLQVAISTNGQGPKLANLIRKHVASNLPQGVGAAIQKTGSLRKKVREIDPNPDNAAYRMGWMSKVCEAWSFEELGQMDEQEMKKLLDGYQSNTVLDPKSLRQSLQNETSEPVKGRIALVGAGPGDPDLLTIGAKKALMEADLVLADRLIHPQILELTEGEVRIARKTKGRSDQAQDELQEWALEGLLQGKKVVRLKIGDPFLFGRGGEEILYFREHGFTPEVIPGISSALSAPMVANVPVTIRGYADQLLITTGRGEKGSMPDIPVYSPMRTTVF